MQGCYCTTYASPLRPTVIHPAPHLRPAGDEHDVLFALHRCLLACHPCVAGDQLLGILQNLVYLGIAQALDICELLKQGAKGYRNRGSD
jgi:hypothetical protein